MIDRGADWLRLPRSIAPDAIVLTHAHPDHARGLANGSRCPVYATGETLALLARYPIEERRPIRPRHPFAIGDVAMEAFAVEHSIRAPAVGYRVTAGARSFFYVPDVVAILDRHEALHGVALYVGDGATILRSMVRRRGSHLIGHTPIRAQIEWCEAEGVRHAVFTHCGSQIVAGEGRRVSRLVGSLGDAHGIDARLAHDGLRLTLDDLLTREA